MVVVMEVVVVEGIVVRVGYSGSCGGSSSSGNR